MIRESLGGELMTFATGTASWFHASFGKKLCAFVMTFRPLVIKGWHVLGKKCGKGFIGGGCQLTLRIIYESARFVIGVRRQLCLNGHLTRSIRRVVPWNGYIWISWALYPGRTGGINLSW
jgi:hypothetical protein